MQDNLFGFHFLVSSAAIVMLLEIIVIVAVTLPVALAVRRITGRTIVELLRRDE